METVGELAIAPVRGGNGCTLDRKTLKFTTILGDNRGSMLPIAAVGLVLLLAMVGSGVDMSRAYRAEQRLQAACDAAVLAGRRTVTTNGFTNDTNATSAAQAYFENNFNQDLLQASNTVFTPTSTDGGNTVKATATTSINTAIMQVFGYNNFSLSVDCSATMGVGNSDVTFVLDTTGSMDDPISGYSTKKINDLKVAVKSFYTTLKAATSGTTARVRYAIVPYSSAVNAGRMIYDLNPAYLADTTPLQSIAPVKDSYGNYDHMEYRQVNFDTSQYKRFNTTGFPIGYQGALVNLTWNGCIEERQTSPDTTFSWSAGSGISTGPLSDLDIDGAPTSDDDTKWKPMIVGTTSYPANFIRRVKYTDWWGNDRYSDSDIASSRYGRSVDSACPAAASGLTTYSTQAAFDTEIDKLTPDGNTYHDIGMIWGGRVSSPDGIFKTTVNASPANGATVSRHIIFMTDGDLNTDTKYYSSYGVGYHDHRVTADGSDEDAEHSARFRAVCDEVKSKGIRIWVIAFGLSVNSDLTYCSSPSSSFTASNSTKLNEAFQTIAKEVGELRITQ